MIKPFLLSILLAGLTAIVAFAKDHQSKIADPELDYVTSPSPEFGGLDDDQVMRLDLDLDGDGKPTVFLTLKRFGSKSGHTWTAYDPVEGGGYRRIDYADDGDHTIQFRTDLYHAGKFPGIANDGGLLILYPGKGSGSLIRYNIKNGLASSQEVRSLNYQITEDKKLFEAIFKRDVDKPLPPEYFTAPPYRVLSAKEIRARIPERLPEPAQVAPPSPTLPSRTSTPAPATPAASSPAPIVAESPASVVEHKSPVWPWLVGILVIIGIAALALSRSRPS